MEEIFPKVKKGEVSPYEIEKTLLIIAATMPL